MIQLYTDCFEKESERWIAAVYIIILDIFPRLLINITILQPQTIPRYLNISDKRLKDVVLNKITLNKERDNVLSYILTHEYYSDMSTFELEKNDIKGITKYPVNPYKRGTISEDTFVDILSYLLSLLLENKFEERSLHKFMKLNNKLTEFMETEGDLGFFINRRMES